MKTIVHHTSKRAWGFETLMTVTSDDGSLWGECVVTAHEPKSYDAIIAEAESIVLNRAALISQKNKEKELVE